MSKKLLIGIAIGAFLVLAWLVGDGRQSGGEPFCVPESNLPSTKFICAEDAMNRLEFRNRIRTNPERYSEDLVQRTRDLKLEQKDQIIIREYEVFRNSSPSLKSLPEIRIPNQ